MISALNALEVKFGDVVNAYITALITEKVWIILGSKFGSDAGRKAIIVCALYGLKSAGDAFRAHLCICTWCLDYIPCLADPDLWYKVELQPDGGFEYYY